MDDSNCFESDSIWYGGNKEGKKCQQSVACVYPGVCMLYRLAARSCSVSLNICAMRMIYAMPLSSCVRWYVATQVTLFAYVEASLATDLTERGTVVEAVAHLQALRQQDTGMIQALLVSACKPRSSIAMHKKESSASRRADHIVKEPRLARLFLQAQ